MRIINIVGARPNFIKIAPIMKAMKRDPFFEPILLHTGQHYDHSLSGSFFKELEIPKPDINLEVGSMSHAKQVAMIMKSFDDVCDDLKPDAILVVGDVNSTMACTLVAAKKSIKSVHVEAGIRSFDRTMPEEVNRLVTDSLADLLLPPSSDAIVNLKHEGCDDKKIEMVGNIMIDSLLYFDQKINASGILSRLKLEKKNFVTLTLHRPSNVDSYENLSSILEALDDIQKKIKIVFPVHPRTDKMIDKFGLREKVNQMANLICIDPVGYFDFGKLIADSYFVLTDSGGIQEETTVRRIPCITIRENTERPVTISEGTNELAGPDRDKITGFANKIFRGDWKKGRVPDMWDGRTAGRILDAIKNKL